MTKKKSTYVKDPHQIKTLHIVHGDDDEVIFEAKIHLDRVESLLKSRGLAAKYEVAHDEIIQSIGSGQMDNLTPVLS